MGGHIHITRPERHPCAVPTLLLGLACGLVLTLGGGVAQAATNFGLIGQFGTRGSGVGEFEETAPRGVAVDQGGNVWVTDGGNARTQEFDSSVPANSLLTFGWGVQNGATEFQTCTSVTAPCQAGISGSGEGQFSRSFLGFIPGVTGVAVAPTTGDVYVADTANNRVEQFSSSGSYQSLFNGEHTPAGSFSIPTGLAVSPATGDVYVMDAQHNVVDRFSSTGVYECQITGQATSSQCGAAGSETPQEGLSTSEERAAGLAVDSSGNLYVADRGHNVVDEFNSAGVYVKQVPVGFALAVAADSSGDVFVSEGSNIVEFDPSGSKLAEFGSSEIGQAIAVATTGSGSGQRVYVGDAANSKVWIFGPVVTPTCSTGTPPISLTATSAMVPGTINPEGIKASYLFEYGASESYGSTSAEVTSWEGDEGTESKEVNESLTGLQPHQTYDYQLVATNTHGSTRCGNQTLKTASAKPSIDEQSTSHVFTQTEATLQARINPNNEETHWHFEYGTNPSLIGASSTPAQEIAAGFGDATASEGVSALQPSTTYYYRVIASNTGGGASEGPIESFLTRPATPATGATSGITQTDATVTGTFNPGGHDTHYYFEYGACELPKTCAESSYPSKSAEIDAGSGTTAVEPTAGLTGLEPLTIYHYRLVVTNAAGNGGGPSYGAEREFPTLPLGPGVTTDPPVTVGASSATLAGEVVPQGAPTTYRVEYGTSTAYGLSAPTPEGEAGASAEGQRVVVSVIGLQPVTTYHYRLVASNSGGTTTGHDEAFVTNATGEPSTGAPPVGFSLTGTSPAGPAATIFPNLAGFGPTPAPKAPTPSATKPLTRAQKLSKALKACRKDKSKAKRAKCQKEARRKYGPVAHRRK